MIIEEVLLKLQNELKKFIKKSPNLKHFLWDSFNDHRNRYKDDLDLIKKIHKDGKILDIGSNPFHLLFCLKELGLDVVGVDIDPKRFKSFINNYKLKVAKCNIESERLPFGNNTFGLIIFNEVFEHLRVDPIKALKEINRVLKPGGTLILTTPNLYAIHKIVMFNIGKSFNNAYHEFNQLNIYGYVGHIREYSTTEVRQFLEKSNFKVEGVIYRNPYSFFKYEGFKNPFLKTMGLIIDILMFLVPVWRRDQVILAKKVG